jgi:hypothetical protein
VLSEMVERFGATIADVQRKVEESLT